MRKSCVTNIERQRGGLVNGFKCRERQTCNNKTKNVHTIFTLDTLHHTKLTFFKQRMLPFSQEYKLTLYNIRFSF